MYRLTNRMPGQLAGSVLRRPACQLLIWLLVLVAPGCETPFPGTGTPGAWRRRADFEGVARSGAAGFTIGSFGYLGTGSDNSNNGLNDFWGYNQLTNSWRQLANFPGVPRSGSVGFSVGNKGYIGLGSDQNGNRLTDFYEYTPSFDLKGLGAWRRIADFGGTARINAVAFTVGSRSYVGTGDAGQLTSDFWAYDPTTNKWSPVASYPGADRTGAVAFVINNIGYVGTGNASGTAQTDWWAYDPNTNRWLAKRNFPDGQRMFIQRSYGVGFAIGSKGYLSQGDATDKNIWEYEPGADTWTPRGTFDGTNRLNSIGFSLGTKGYISTGSSGKTRFDDLWELDPGF